jgi:hypothetical protein
VYRARLLCGCAAQRCRPRAISVVSTSVRLRCRRVGPGNSRRNEASVREDHRCARRRVGSPPAEGELEEERRSRGRPFRYGACQWACAAVWPIDSNSQMPACQAEEGRLPQSWPKICHRRIPVAPLLNVAGMTPVIGAPAEGDRCGLSAAQGDWKHAGAIRGESIKVRVKMTAGDRVIARGGPTSVRWPTSIPQFTCRLSAAASASAQEWVIIETVGVARAYLRRVAPPST